MSFLRMTMIDVGWGDSLFLEADDAQGVIHYALIDSNDTSNYASSRIFLKRYFEKQRIDVGASKPIFDFVILSHNHSDHGQGLKALMRDFGTGDFWYSKSNKSGTLANLIRYANRSNNVGDHEAIDTTKMLPDFGQSAMTLLWPKRKAPESDENNNSIVLQLELGDVSFVLSGDAEEDVWNEIADQIPTNTRVFKIPHHGSRNGFFAGNGQANWLDRLPNAQTVLGISGHVVPFNHPHDDVIDELENSGFRSGQEYFRTDVHYHVSFETDGIAGNNIRKCYWHEV